MFSQWRIVVWEEAYPWTTCRGLVEALVSLCACESYMAGDCEHARVWDEFVRGHIRKIGTLVSLNSAGMIQNKRAECCVVLC